MKNSIILMRHGTALKNKKNEHGGYGTSLANEGIIEVNEVASVLNNINVPLEIIYCVNRLQCLETASILSNLCRIPYESLNDIEPFNLGILDGLSEEQAMNLYPEVSKKMELWRNGKIDISQLDIPGATDPVQFFEKCKQVMIPILGKNSLVVATRSILVAFASILLGRKPYSGGGYVEIPWINSQFTIFNQHKNAYVIDETFSINNIK